MSSSTLQYAVAGILGLAWAWMLGRPLLLGALKKSRRNSIGYFREQQAALASAGEYPEPRTSLWDRRPRPISAWLDQSVENRRLQMLLGSALATFGTLLLAIALKGIFWSLFIVALISFVAYVSFAAYVGASRLRHQEAQSRVRHEAVVTAERQRRTLVAQAIVDSAPDTFVQQSIFQQQSLFGGEVQDELTDESDPYEHDGQLYTGDDELTRAELELAEKDLEFDSEERLDEEVIVDVDRNFVDYGKHPAEDRSEIPVDASASIDESFFEPIAEFSVAPLDIDAVVAEAVQTSYQRDAKYPADFAPDPTNEIFVDRPEASDRVSKPLRPASRPIYIESLLDDGGDHQRAVND